MRKYAILEALLKAGPHFAYELGQVTGLHPIAIGKLLKRMMNDGFPLKVTYKYAGNANLRLWSYVG